MIDELLRRIAAFHRSRPTVPEFPMVTLVLDALSRAESPTFVQAEPLPVTRWLREVEPTGLAPVDAIVEEFVRLGPSLPWRRTASYLDVLGDDYLDNYGYVQLVGPGAMVEDETVRIGIGLWGPNLHYPAHRHEAEELYHVLAGEPRFGDGAGSSRQTGPGDAVHNVPWQVHSLDFGDTPTLLLYCWAGRVADDAELIDVG